MFFADPLCLSGAVAADQMPADQAQVPLDGRVKVPIALGAFQGHAETLLPREPTPCRRELALADRWLMKYRRRTDRAASLNSC